MTGFLISVFGFVLAVGILVTVHEFGHFWVARSLGVKVLKFSIGFGRSIWSWRGKRDGTEYAVAMIPLGGYVRMLDESEGDVSENELDRAFNRKSLGVRSAVVLAGPAFNFLFAIVAYWLIFTIGVEGVRPVVGEVLENSVASRSGILVGDRILTVDGKRTQTWGEHRLYLMDRLLDGEPVELILEAVDGARKIAVLSLAENAAEALSPSGLERSLGMRPKLPLLQAVAGTIVEDSPASMAGLKPGDRIVNVNGQVVESWGQLVELISPRAGESLIVGIERDETRTDLELVPDTIVVGDKKVGRIGIGPKLMPPGDEYLTHVKLGVVESLSRAVENTWTMSVLTLKMLYRMLKLEISTENLSGPITIAQYAGQTVQIGFIPFLTFLAIISVSLGVLNLLPIPVLDGGHLLYYIVELFRGGPVPERVMYWGQQLGIFMLACLMGLAFYNDILRLIR